MDEYIKHESAIQHVTGEAVYIDDIPADDRLLAGYVVYSKYARAKIKSFDLSEAKKFPGVHAVLCYKDIPGENQMGPVIKDEPCLAEGEVHFVGQAIFLIAAENEDICRQAEKKIKINYSPKSPILTIEDAIKNKSLLGLERKIKTGDVEKTLKNSEHLISGEFRTGAQEHWYLETQACLCIPGEKRELLAYSSTQHPTETQTLIASVLGIPRNEVVVEVRRMGGAFGGKETQANHTACWTAMLCKATGLPVKMRLFRDDDQKITGKRHPYLIKYRAGFSNQGILSALKIELNSNGGAATDLSFAIMERAMFHVDNAYYIPNLEVVGRVWKTNLPPNTALRGFGAPQAIAAIENLIDRIARILNKDPAYIRKKNFYGIKTRNKTHYGQVVERNHLNLIYNKIVKSAQYEDRRAEINDFNQNHIYVKKGMAIMPVKFGISFTTSFLNQAGALVHIYQDGSVLINHGGTEMGQGLHTKILQIASAELGVSIDRIKISATNTSKVPNTSATAASSGSDLNGMAVKDAIETIKDRLAAHALNKFRTNLKTKSLNTRKIKFKNNAIFNPDNPKIKISFDKLIQSAYLAQISLSATGYYRTPLLNWDKNHGSGRPFNYYAFGLAVSEVVLDILTGSHRIIRTDILHDVGDSLNPQIDIGQIQGGFIQGLGWCTTEDCKWDTNGRLLNHSPDTYKIPVAGDIPRLFNIELLKNKPNPNAIRKSKAIGEPPLMLAISVWLAIKDAISAIYDHKREPILPIPATNESILLCIENLKMLSTNQKF
jgi:xanthine dehydrogenase molybdopterin binding subunit